MEHILEKAVNDLTDKGPGYPITDFEKGQDAMLTDSTEMFESLYGKVISLEDLKEIAEQVYEEKAKDYDGTSVWTNMYTAYLTIGAVVRDNIIKRAEALAAERAKAIEEENARIGGKH